MSVAVPLSLRVGNEYVSKEVVGLRFRKEAVGGCASIEFQIPRTLNKHGGLIQEFKDVYVFDNRSGTEIAGGWISDVGRSADPSSGEWWDVMCMGAKAHAEEIETIYYGVDTTFKQWEPGKDSTGSANHFRHKNSSTSDAVLRIKVENGVLIGSSWMGDWVNMLPELCAQSFGSFQVDWSGGSDLDSGDTARILSRVVGGSAIGTADSSVTGGAGTTLYMKYTTTNVGSTDNEIIVRLTRDGINHTSNGFFYISFRNPILVTRLQNELGNDRTAGYYSLGFKPSVNDLITDICVRFCKKYDIANAVLFNATHTVSQFVYSHGATPRAMFWDLMKVVQWPGFYWTTGPRNSSGQFAFYTKAWPTTVRYEATLDDGGDFPITVSDLVNRVTVRWRDGHGHEQSNSTTYTNPLLDQNNHIVRKIIDVSDEAGNANDAQDQSDFYAADHKYPANTGTLNISRPIKDLYRGCWVDPWEIEPASLIRVRGLESYHDALNPNGKDGQTVFRIWAMDYDADSNTSILELDGAHRMIPTAIRKLHEKRNRE